MIDSYNVKIENGEEVLYLFFDFNFEFSYDFNGSFLPTNFKDKVLNNINNLGGIFKGKKVILVVGGIIVCTFLFTCRDRQVDDDGSINNYINSSIIKQDNLILESIEAVNQQETVENKKNDNQQEIVESIISNPKEDSTINSKDVQIGSNDKVIGKNSTNKVVKSKVIDVSTDMGTNNNEKSTSNNVISNTKEEVNVLEEEKEAKEMVTFSNSGKMVTMEFEEYLIGVVAAEMPASFSIEALKAQALVARTYALNRISLNKSLTSDSSTQNYKDINWMKGYWENSFSTYYNKVKKAVYDTEGQVITYGGKYIDAVYFSTSNGYTESAYEVWGYDVPYLISVESFFDKNTTPYLREVCMNIVDVNRILGYNINTSSQIEILRNNSGRVKSIIIDNHSYIGLDFQKIFLLRSNDYDITITETSVIFTTRGYGHGVGMSQYGANMLALKGYNYLDIIKYYYKGVVVDSY